MPKITFMGAGSTVFARNVLGDCMCTPSLCESEIALYDIDAERLEESYIILSAINKNTNGGKATLKTYCGVENRKEALRGAEAAHRAVILRLAQQRQHDLHGDVANDEADDGGGKHRDDDVAHDAPPVHDRAAHEACAHHAADQGIGHVAAAEENNFHA